MSFETFFSSSHVYLTGLQSTASTPPSQLPSVPAEELLLRVELAPSQILLARLLHRADLLRDGGSSRAQIPLLLAKVLVKRSALLPAYLKHVSGESKVN
jgi:hypothetical protein